MSNEHHDMASLRGTEMGLDALHAKSADELLMDVPFDEWGADRNDLADVADGVGRDALMLAVTTQCFAGRPSLEEAGLRFCAMAHRAGCEVAMSANERRAMRAVIVKCNGTLALPPCADAARVHEFLRGGETEPRLIGRRLSLLAYAFNRGPVIREALPSLESIGRLWQLTAQNKRSAVCAAMQKLRDEIRRGGWMCGHRDMRSFKFWFEKSPDAKAVYAAAQRGNRNRGGGADDDDGEDVREIVNGIPVKAEWRGLSALELRRRLNALAKEKETF